MFKKIKTKIEKLKNNLFNLDKHSIGKASLVVIIFLDLFILISIFNGVDEHTDQLSQPYEFIPQSCRDIAIDNEWNDSNRLLRVASTVTRAHSYYYYEDEREKNRPRHALCAPISKLFVSIKDDRGLSSNLKEFINIRSEINDLGSELERVKGAYDTSLLGEIAGKTTLPNNLEAIKNEVANKSESLNKLINKQRLLESSLQQDKRIQQLFTFVDNISEKQKTTLRNDLRRLNFWYPVKRLGMEMIFLLPLFLIFYLWNSKSISGKRPFQTLVSSHLLVIAFIPVFFKIIELIYDVIPKKILKHIIELLESLNLVAVWHYLLMAVSILIALALIYLFQKKLFSREKIIEKRIAKGLCQECNKLLPANTAACPFCGFKQFKKCSKCNQPTYIYGKYCKECASLNDE
ncbi:MAG: zinc ribbon domain-containing protein [Gammaproteobacteria bacterium]|nr:zinc ribbon domain-containing protein [Gammaproteobacteria bacterium]